MTPGKEIVWKYVNPVRGASLGGPASPYRLVEVMPAATRQALKLTNEQNRRLDALQPEFESKLAGILSADQAKQLKAPPKSAGPGGTRPDASAQGIRLLPTSIEKLLKITPEQKKNRDGLQGEADARLASILTDDQAKQLEKIRSVLVNGWGPGGPPSLGNALYRSYRYAADYPGLKQRDLKPGKTVEELEALVAPGK